MQKQKGFTLIELLIVIVVVGILAFSSLGPVYGWMNSKTVIGTVDNVTPIMEDGGMALGEGATRMAKSTAVALKMPDSSYFTFSSEDRQWFALKTQAGKKCVKALAYPYAPWHFGKGGTYHNGRLIEMADSCDKIK
jgi:prepilin-type N-terminal cleavage/methylation domain-containing protein